MFFHNYLYRLKCIIRDKQTMFWTFLFPLLLGTLFYMAFSNLQSAQLFSEIKIGIVDDDAYRKNIAFVNFIDMVSNSDNQDNNIFNVEYGTQEEVNKLLEDNKIKGYIDLDDGIKLVVKESGIEQTILKSFLDDFKQTTSTLENVRELNPSVGLEELIKSISNRTEYLKEVTAGKTNPNPIVNYFYTLIAMGCLFGGFLGLKEVTAIQANLSSQGARVSMAPTHKLRLFLSSMFAAVTVQLGVIFVLLGYLILILKIDFGSRVGYIILTCIVGTITGVSFGTLIATVIKKGENVKIGFLVIFTNLMSFLAGMMYDKMKYIISTNAPILGYLNPANLISDSFYSLYYYDTYTQYYIDIALLCGFISAFCLISYLILRRQKYDSL